MSAEQTRWKPLVLLGNMTNGLLLAPLCLYINTEVSGLLKPLVLSFRLPTSSTSFDL